LKKEKKMKITKTLAIIIAASAAMISGASADTARLQVIHNAADPAADVVDIYVNDALFLDDFAFRAATPFVDVPAEVNLNIGVAPGNSTGPGDIIADFDVTLEDGKTYVAIANGVLNPDSFAVNPDGESIAFNLFARDGIKESSPYSHYLRLIAFHGATDAPTVDILTRGAWPPWPLFNNLTYGEFSSYRWVRARAYTLDVTPGNDNSTVVASFTADLSALGGGAAVVFASGFLNPGANQNGTAFGLFAALPDGQVVALPAEEQTARLQVIHNAADPAAAVVDIYVNDELFLDDFAFRAATPFVDVPAGVNLNIGVAPGNSTGPNQIIADFDVTLENDETYVAIANGVLNPDSFAVNPDGESIAFNLYPRDDIREQARWRWFTDLIVFHGATDAPTVDVMLHGFNFRPLFDDVTYGEFSRYRTLIPFNFVLDITPGDDNNTVVASFEADLRGLRGMSAVVFASGFLNPGNNQNGAPFGLFVALPDGQVVELPAAEGGELLAAAKLDVIPDRFELNQNYPNPFNPTTTISYSLAEPTQVSLKVYDLLGREVTTLVNEYKEAGEHRVEFNANGIPSGVYFYKINAGNVTDTRKMTLLK
jgi:hypothetical protein